MKLNIYLLGTMLLLLNQPFSHAQHNALVNAPVGEPTRKEVAILVGLGGACTYTYGGLWPAQTVPIFFIEPQYSLSARLNMGLRTEVVLPSTYRATYLPVEPTYSLVKASAMYSIGLTLDYNLTPSTWAYIPFVGVGIGHFFRGSGVLLSNPALPSVNLGMSSGVIIRAGVSSKNVLISAEMNVLNENQSHGGHITWWGHSGEFRGRSYASLKASLPLVLLLP